MNFLDEKQSFENNYLSILEPFRISRGSVSVVRPRRRGYFLNPDYPFKY